MEHVVSGLTFISVALCFTIGRRHLIAIQLKINEWQFEHPVQLSRIGYLFATVVFISGIYLIRESLVDGCRNIVAAAVLALFVRIAFRPLLLITREINNHRSTDEIVHVLTTVAAVFSGLYGIDMLLSAILHKPLK